MNYRHGDLALIQVKELPKGLKKEETKILMIGSNNHPHSFDNGEFYLKKENNFVFGYFVAENNTNLYHLEHGNKIKGENLRKAKIKKGIYQLRNQCEDTNQGMKPVVD